MAARKYPAVLITWDDAEVSNDWEIQNANVELEASIVETLGFLVQETEQYYLVASTLAGEHTNARTKIPKGMVKSIRKIRA